MLEIRDLCRSYREGDREHRVLDGVSLELARGQSVAIMGRSGSGKSTLLNLICGIDRAESGRVRLDGEDIGTLAEPQRTLLRRTRMGFVYQFFNLIPTLNVLENVSLVLDLNGVRGAAARTRSLAALQSVGLAARASSAVDRLSGGEQQRVAIVRALVHAPQLLLADEPTGNLDEASAREVLPLLFANSRAHGAMLLVVTHDAQLASHADRVLELRDGRLQEMHA